MDLIASETMTMRRRLAKTAYDMHLSAPATRAVLFSNLDCEPPNPPLSLRNGFDVCVFEVWIHQLSERDMFGAYFLY
jgi:hypothetical protein